MEHHRVETNRLNPSLHHIGLARGLSETVFKTVAFVRSATLPPTEGTRDVARI